MTSRTTRTTHRRETRRPRIYFDKTRGWFQISADSGTFSGAEGLGSASTCEGPGGSVFVFQHQENRSAIGGHRLSKY